MKTALVILTALAVIVLPHAWHVYVFNTGPKMVLFLGGISFVQFVFTCIWCNYIHNEF